MTSPFTQFNYRDAQGQQRSARSSAQAPGFAGFDSEAIGPNGMTASGDARNPFRGFVSADGGRFGGDYSTPGSARQMLEGVITNRNINDFGITDTTSAEDIRGLTDRAARMVMRDRDAIAGGLTDANRGLQSEAMTQLSRDLNYRDASQAGTANDPLRIWAQRMSAMTPEQRAQVMGGLSAGERSALEQAGQTAPTQGTQSDEDRRNLLARDNARPVRDPLGRNDDPTAANNVITPQTEARLRAQQERPMEPLDPFSPFMANATPQAQVGQNPGVMMAQQGLQPASFADAGVRQPRTFQDTSAIRAAKGPAVSGGPPPDASGGPPPVLANLGINDIPDPDLTGGNPTPAGQTPPQFRPFGSPLAGGGGASGAGVPPASGASPTGFGGGFRRLGFGAQRAGTNQFLRPIAQRRRPVAPGGAAAPDPNAAPPLSAQAL